MRTKIALAALAATAALASPAMAQTTASEPAEARGTVLLPLTLTEDANLDFGTVLASAAAGNVIINSDTGVRSVTGGVSMMTTSNSACAWPNGSPAGAGRSSCRRSARTRPLPVAPSSAR